MAWPIDTSRYDVDAPGSTDLFADIINQIGSNTSAISNSVNASNVPALGNGSFEEDATGTATPASWAYLPLSGGSGIVTDTDSYHGAQSYKATHSGASGGGVSLTTQDYLPVSVAQAFELFFSARSTNADVRVKVSVSWYDEDPALIGTAEIVFDVDGSFPTVWTPYRVELFPVTGAKYMKIEVVLGDPSRSTAADIYLDNVTLVYRRPMISQKRYSGTGGPFTVPSGVYQMRARMFGRAMGSGYGGYSDVLFSVVPGNQIDRTVATGNNGVSRVKRNGTDVATVMNATTDGIFSSGDGTGSIGTYGETLLSITGGSCSRSSFIILEY